MIIAHAAASDHHELLIVGLSAENRRRLGNGLPIELHLQESIGPLTILIFGGETEASMQAELTGLLDARAAIVTQYRQEGQ